MGDSFAREFEATGRIWPAFINQLGASIRDTDDEDVLALHAYALKHGPRGPVEGWTA